MPGGRLTSHERQRIAAGVAEGRSYAEIGRSLGRPASTIQREVTRNGGPDDYAAGQAQQATRRRARRRKQAPPPEVPRALADGHGRDLQAVHHFEESFTGLLVQQGLSRMTARVLTSLLIADSGSLTAAELVERLRISPASVSSAVTFLEQQGLLERERDPGERRERYVVDDEIWLRSTQASLQMNDALAAESQRGAEVLGASTPAGERFADSAEFLRLVSDSHRRAMTLWRQRTAARKTGRP